MKDLYACDIETTGLDRFTDKILCIGVYSPSHKFVFDNTTQFSEWLERNPRAQFIFHNGSFDIGFLRHNNLDVRHRWFYDTRSIASILTPRPDKLGLEFLAEAYLGQVPYKLNRTKMAEYSKSEVRDYCLKDCELTYKLFTYLEQQLNNKAHVFSDNWVMPATKLCSDMEYDGVYIDKVGLDRYQAVAIIKRDQLLVELREQAKLAIVYYHELQVKEVNKQYREKYEKAKEKTKDQKKCLNRYALLESTAVSRLEPFNWNSPKQLQWLLKDYYALDVSNKDGEDSTSEAVLRSLDHPVCQKLCDYREIEKLVGTCIPALTENQKPDGAVHTHYHIGGTRTGRLSSSAPNLQQIPRLPELRSYVQASTSARVLATIDYAQIEVRIIAEITKETELINAFKDKIDPYSVIAQKLLKINCDVRDIKTKFKKERDVCKTAGLSILYGTGAAKLQEVLNKELNKSYSVYDCKKFIEEYRNSFPAVKAFKQKLEQSLANKKVYYNLLGRPFSILDNEMLYMTSLNTLVQGSASDMVVKAALMVKQKLQELKVDFNFRMLIHDEMVIELPKDEADLLVTEVIVPTLTTELAKDLQLTVPLDVEYSIDRSWHKP